MTQPQQRCCECRLWLVVIGASLVRMSLAFVPSLAGPAHSGLYSRRGFQQTPIRIANRAASWRRSPMRAGPSDKDVSNENSAEKLVGIEDFLAQKAAREQEQSLFGGGMFPSDFATAAASNEITVQAATLKLYGTTGKQEDVSGRVILRADGQVIGGPTVRQTPGVKWSDPEGLKPVGGEWIVYKDPQNGRTRLNMTIMLSHQKKQQLEMDGVIMMVDTFDPYTGESGPQPQIFGSVSKRSGDTEMEAGEGDFSMMKVPTGEDKLIASVGSQQRRLW